MSDLINHPDHYGGKDNPLEVINIIEFFNLNFCLGNVIKYILRAETKNIREQLIIEDYEKARWYLNRHIENLKQRLKNEEN